jgi:hypothetical protein
MDPGSAAHRHSVSTRVNALAALRSVRGTLDGTMAGMTMRFAAIADVHGNYLALEAVIADIRAQSWRAARSTRGGPWTH